MARIQITNPTPFIKGGRIYHNPLDGRAYRRCRVCGCIVHGRHGGICRNCLAARTRTAKGGAR